MPRYIDADALLKKQTTIRVTYHCQGADEWDDYEVVLVKDINNAPTISPDEVRGVGKWEHQDIAPTNWTFCSVCGRQRSKKYKWYYCPNCGARMEETEDA